MFCFWKRKLLKVKAPSHRQGDCNGRRKNSGTGRADFCTFINEDYSKKGKDILEAGDVKIIS